MSQSASVPAWSPSFVWRQGFFKSFATVRDQHGPKTLLLEQHADGVAQAFVIINDQNGLHLLHAKDCYLCSQLAIVTKDTEW